MDSLNLGVGCEQEKIMCLHNQLNENNTFANFAAEPSIPFMKKKMHDRYMADNRYRYNKYF